MRPICVFTLLASVLLWLAPCDSSATAPVPRNRCPDVAFIMHTNYKEDTITSFSARTFLANVSLVIMTGNDYFTSSVGFAGDWLGDRTTQHRGLTRISYNGNPGTYGKTYTSGGGRYRGVTRPMAGLLIANDTFPSAKWFYIFDDDNYIAVQYVCDQFAKLDATVPLLLSGAVGPKTGGHAPCNAVNTPEHWSCCTDATRACIAYINGVTPMKQALWLWDADLKTMTPRACDAKHCHQSVPWPEGMMYGFPYRLRLATRVADATPHHAMMAPHQYSLFPYGGATYALSKGMLDAIGRDVMEMRTYGIQWDNADIDVMQVVFNAGYSITSYPAIEAPHHVKSVAMMISTGVRLVAKETEEVRVLLCQQDAENIAAGPCNEICPECPQFSGADAPGKQPPQRRREVRAVDGPGPGLAHRSSLRGAK